MRKLVFFAIVLGIKAFTMSPRQPDRLLKKSIRRKLSFLHMAGLFDDIKNFFEELGDSNRTRIESSDDDDELPAGTTRISTIPVKSIKPGGLRLFLMLYLMGMQNTPDQGSWQADQPSTEEYVVDFWFHDNSAVLTVTLSEKKKEITIDRVGSIPSTAYMMQESVIVEGLLEELKQIENATDVAVEDRLLILHEPRDAIEKAKEELAFG